MTGDAEVTVSSRVAPTDEPELAQTSIYLYKQRDTGTWKRIARSDTREDFAATATLGEGAYRVIVTGRTTDAYGQFLLKMDVWTR